MAMTEHILCAEQDVREGRGKRVIAGTDEIALFRVDGKVCAVSNMCPHQKFQKLHDGLVKDGTVMCPMHGWTYDIRTGRSTNASGVLKVYPVQIVNGNVILEMEDDGN